MNKKNLSKLFSSTRPYKDELIINFGRMSEESDVDIISISLSSPSYEQIRIGKLDVIIIPMHLAISYAARFDLLIQESFSNGEIIIDHTEIRSQIENSLTKHASISEIISHNLLRSINCRITADSYYKAIQYGNNSREMALRVCSSLSWSCSYYIYSKHLFSTKTITTLSLDQLFSEPQGEILSKIRLAEKSLEKTIEPITFDVIKNLMFEADTMYLE